MCLVTWFHLTWFGCSCRCISVRPAFYWWNCSKWSYFELYKGWLTSSWPRVVGRDFYSSPHMHMQFNSFERSSIKFEVNNFAGIPVSALWKLQGGDSFKILIFLSWQSLLCYLMKNVHYIRSLLLTRWDGSPGGSKEQFGVKMEGLC